MLKLNISVKCSWTNLFSIKMSDLAAQDLWSAFIQIKSEKQKTTTFSHENTLCSHKIIYIFFFYFFSMKV